MCGPVEKTVRELSFQDFFIRGGDMYVVEARNKEEVIARRVADIMGQAVRGAEVYLQYRPVRVNETISITNQDEYVGGFGDMKLEPIAA